MCSCTSSCIHALPSVCAAQRIHACGCVLALVHVLHIVCVHAPTCVHTLLSLSVCMWAPCLVCLCACIGSMHTLCPANFLVPTARGTLSTSVPAASSPAKAGHRGAQPSTTHPPLQSRLLPEKPASGLGSELGPAADREVSAERCRWGLAIQALSWQCGCCLLSQAPESPAAEGVGYCGSVGAVSPHMAGQLRGRAPPPLVSITAPCLPPPGA